MPTYATVRNRQTSYGKGAALLPQLKNIYDQVGQVRAALALYNAGTDADFNTAINSIFSVAERAQLNSMLTQMDTLYNTWTTNHAALLAAETG